MMTVKISEIVTLQALGKIEKSKYSHKRSKENKKTTKLQEGLRRYGARINFKELIT